MAGKDGKDGKEINIRVRVITNYGRHSPGAVIEVSEREYNKFKKPDGEGWFAFGVFISQADEAENERRRKAAEQAKMDAQAKTDERSRTEGWQRYQAESLRRVQAMRIQQQHAQQEALTGLPPAQLSQEQQQAQFRERVATARTG